MERLFVDTSAWFAYANRKEPRQKIVSAALLNFSGRLVTSNLIFDETISLCRCRLGHQAARAVGSVLLDPNEVDVLRVTANDERAAWELFCSRNDQRYSYTDCASFSLMRRLGLSLALALDEDFRAEGFASIL